MMVYLEAFTPRLDSAETIALFVGTGITPPPAGILFAQACL